MHGHPHDPTDHLHFGIKWTALARHALLQLAIYNHIKYLLCQSVLPLSKAGLYLGLC